MEILYCVTTQNSFAESHFRLYSEHLFIGRFTYVLHNKNQNDFEALNFFLKTLVFSFVYNLHTNPENQDSLIKDLFYSFSKSGHH